MTDSARRRRLELQTVGNSKLVVWNIGPDDTSPGLESGDWRRYICVEPAVIPRREGFYLAPGEKREIGLSIRPESL